MKLKTKEEIIAAWKATGYLDGLKGLNNDPRIAELYSSVPSYTLTAEDTILPVVIQGIRKSMIGGDLVSIPEEEL